MGAALTPILLLFACASHQAVDPALNAGGSEEALSIEELEDIKRVEHAGNAAITACYTAELERRGTKDLVGKVTVQLHIQSTGNVRVVNITGSTLNAPLVHRCIQQVIEGWEFPPLRTAAWYGTAYVFDPAY
jgi:hypothetical protein